MGFLRMWLERGAFAFIVLFLLFFGLVQGAQVQRFTLDLFFVVVELAFLDAVSSSLGFAAFFLLSAVIFLYRLFSWTEVDYSGAEGSVVCVVPSYKDADVLHRSVESLLDSEYGDLRVVGVLEEDDDEGIKIASQMEERFDRFECMVNGYPGSKAGALNYAVENTDSDYIGFFDADQVVPASFVPQCVKLLEDYQVVQGRNVPKPDGLFESLSYYESVFFTYVSRQFLGLFTGFSLVGSRSVLMRRTVFEELGGYSDDTLTEDYDFTHKCYINHVNVSDIPVPIENLAAHSLRDWWGQRKRWMTGVFQVFSKLSGKLVRDFKGRRSLFSVLICGGSLLGSFLMLTIVSKFLLLLFVGAKFIYAIPISVLVLTALIFRVYDKKYSCLDKIGWNWAFLPLIFPFFSAITIRAFVGFLFSSEATWYRVEK